MGGCLYLGNLSILFKGGSLYELIKILVQILLSMKLILDVY